MTAARDFLGQKYGVGDFVAYATTSGRSPVLKLGKVHKIETVLSDRWDHKRQQMYLTATYKVGVEWLDTANSWTSPAPTGSGKARLSYPNPDNIVFVSHYEPVR